MSRKRRPNGRECAVVRATLSSLKEVEQARKNGRDPVASAVAPVVATWRDAGQGGIRLIDLERRAHFARVAS